MQAQTQSVYEDRGTVGWPKQKRNTEHCPASLPYRLPFLIMFSLLLLRGTNLLRLFIFSVYTSFFLISKLQSFSQSGSRRKHYKISCWSLQSVIRGTYLNDITEHKDVKPGQVLDMVLLNHFDMSSDQSPDLLQQEEELRNGPVEMRTRKDTDIDKTM